MHFSQHTALSIHVTMVKYLFPERNFFFLEFKFVLCMRRSGNVFTGFIQSEH